MQPTIHDIQQAIVRARAAATGFAARTRSVGLLDIHVLDRLLYLEERAALPADLQALRAQASALKGHLEAANARSLRGLRRRIAAGRCGPGPLRRAFLRLAERTETDGDDALDLLTAGLLATGSPGEEQAVREPDMVHYQPTPTRQILALIEQAGIGPQDTVCDLGSGLGQVVLLVALLSGARATGVEFEPAYHDYAQAGARQLNVPGAEFVCADARVAPLGRATVFYLYTPFRGALLRSVLDRLRAQAQQRPIRVCTYGPCTAHVAREPWLKPREGGVPGADEIAVFTASL